MKFDTLIEGNRGNAECKNLNSVTSIYAATSLVTFFAIESLSGLKGNKLLLVHLFLYARLKNSRIILYPSASVRPSVLLSVRPSVNFFVSV